MILTMRVKAYLCVVCIWTEVKKYDTHTKDPTGVIFMEEGDGKTVKDSRWKGAWTGPTISTVLGDHNNQPTATLKAMLYSDSDTLQLVYQASMASLLTVLQDGSDPSFTDQAKARLNLTRDNWIDYSDALCQIRLVAGRHIMPIPCGHPIQKHSESTQNDTEKG